MNRVNRKKGFGVLEVLLASIIIVIVVGALVFLARNTLNNSVYLQEKAQATYLAQEGIEIVRQIRDTSYIDGDNQTKWNTLIVDGLGGFRVPSSPDSVFYIHMADTGEYQLKTDLRVETIDNIDFDRKITFKIDEEGLLDGDSDLQKNALIAIVTVEWQNSHKEGSVEIRELITNSHQGF